MIESVRKVGVWAVLALALLIGAGQPAMTDDDAALNAAVSSFEAGDYAAALSGFKPLADQGSPVAAYWLGHMYDLGLGVDTNAETAAGWYSKAAEGGLVKAKLRLGQMYLSGSGVLQDYEQAHKWLEGAAYNGNAVAQRELGTMYENGWGSEKDPVSAYVWYDFAAAGGDVKAKKARDALLKSMTHEQVKEAQALAMERRPEVMSPEPH